jgi:predicted RNase H-related nuclease YkuK (DUF458 family)
MFRNKFKQFGGAFIPDIVEYLKNYIQKDPGCTITVGCDSIQKRRRTVYACTIMMYNTDIKNGAHVVFFRETVSKIRDHFERLHKEAQYCLDIAEFLDNELSQFYTRQDLKDSELKKYKYHLQRCAGENKHIELQQESNYIKNLPLADYERNFNYKLVDIHLDFNPDEGIKNERGVAKNKSNMAYKAYAPWIRGLGFRVFAKPLAWGASTAADLLLQD